MSESIDTRLPVPGPRAIRVLVSMVGLAVAALLVWVAGSVAVGQFGEDICLTDVPEQAGGYQAEASWFPPSMTCVYGLTDGSVARVEHPLFASVRSAWAFGFPVLALIGLTVVGSRFSRRLRSQS